VWENKAPPRVQFFAWLLVQERIQCRSNLVKKHVVAENMCEVCAQEEDCSHIIFRCSFESVDNEARTVAALWNVTPIMRKRKIRFVRWNT
jgi:hypothetical protein